MKYLVLFDIDGTILTFQAKLAKTLFTCFLTELFGQEIPDEKIPNFAGMTDLQILKEITQSINVPEDEMQKNLAKIWDNIFELFKKHTTSDTVTLLPGSRELIADFHSDPNIQLGLITGNFADNAYLKLSAHSLEKYFPFGAFGDDHADRNKLPIIAINRANEFCKNSNFNAQNTIIIGDTQRDIECGKVNNIPVISVASGYFTREHLEPHYPDLLIDDLTNINEIKDFIYNL